MENLPLSPDTIREDAAVRAYKITATRDGESVSLGATTEGGFTWTELPSLVPMPTDQVFPSNAFTLYQGVAARCQVTLYRVAPAFIAQWAYGNKRAVLGDNLANGPAFGYGIGTGFIEPCELTCVPISNTTTGDYRNSFYMSSAQMTPDSTISFISSKTAPQNVTLTFESGYSDTAPAGFEYGCSGNISALVDQAAPATVFIQTAAANAPYNALTAFSMYRSGIMDLQAYGYWSAASGVTAAIDDADDITANDTSIVFDTLAGGSAFTVGRQIKIGSEYMLISAATSTTLTVKRGYAGTTPASALDNAVITEYTGYVVNITNFSTWASSNTADATVGNTQDGTGANRRGRVAGVVGGGGGTGNITATFQSVASANCVFTTT